METTINFSCHDHPLTPSSGFALRCYWCKTGGYIRNGYHCNQCDLWFHKECVNGELSSRKIMHTSHPEHFLINYGRRIFLVTYWCHMCKRRIEDSEFYACYECQDIFSLHVSCAIEQPSLTIKHPQVHEHPLVFFPLSKDSKNLCEVCTRKVIGKLAYRCFECSVVIHVECASSSEVNHLCHPKHSLKLLTSGAPDYTDSTCLLCGLILEDVLYHCSECNFSVCLGCSIIPPPLDIKHLKTHDHNLTLMARQISFTCNACGTKGDRSPYFCLQCDFMVHRSCIGLPRVISINLHDHRISYTRKLGFRDQICRVCLQSVNQFYGAYSCSVCINYVVHSKCATKNDVWDGIELEGIPEEFKDIKPFKEVGDNLINHMSHEKHNLKLIKDGLSDDGSIRCEACMRLVYFDPIYNCEECDFVLHETCANLPLKKRHMFHTKPFTLHVNSSPTVYFCSACGELFNGFRYESDNVVLDVSCILINEFLSHEKHSHPLHYENTYIGKCNACDKSVESAGALSCASCDFSLDFYCASLPKKVKHSCDQHPLYLSCNFLAIGKCLCDICEDEMDPNQWFYFCNDCGVITHVKCVLGDFSRLKPGRDVELGDQRYQVIQNNHSSRPICSICSLRCKVPFVLKTCYANIFVCSKRCYDKRIDFYRN